MREHTRKHRTERQWGVDSGTHHEDDAPMSLDEATAKICKGRPQWAVTLRGLRNREGLTQQQLGEALGIAQTNISQMERGIRAIGKEVAKRLASVFKTDYRLFL